MDHRDVHHILRNLSAKLTCPHCKARISDKYIKILNIFEKDCVFYVVCPQCQANMVMGAHVEDTPETTTNDLTTNFSTRIQQESDLTSISETELLQIGKTLQSFDGSFSKLFKKKK